MIRALKLCTQRSSPQALRLFTLQRLISHKTVTQTVSTPPTHPSFQPLRFCSRDPTNTPFIAQSESLRDDQEVTIPDPPTTCCMSGCANCVWIEYAKELAAIYKDGGQAAERVMKAIEDPSLKIFLSLELREALKNTD